MTKEKKKEQDLLNENFFQFEKYFASVLIGFPDRDFNPALAIIQLRRIERSPGQFTLASHISFFVKKYTKDGIEYKLTQLTSMDVYNLLNFIMKQTNNFDTFYNNYRMLNNSDDILSLANNNLFEKEDIKQKVSKFIDHKFKNDNNYHIATYDFETGQVHMSEFLDNYSLFVSVSNLMKDIDFSFLSNAFMKALLAATSMAHGTLYGNKTEKGVYIPPTGNNIVTPDKFKK